MYRHLLVPVDGTDLSVEVVGNAVALARPLGARITFFHAVADAAGSLRGDAEVLRLTARDEYEYAYLGKARELLAKAEAAARALGVPCESRHVVSDKPAQAIVEAARASGCDLIFMASHGHRGKLGMAFASETLAVLMNAGLPVLVSSTGEPAAPARAIGIIRDEHRSLAAVMHAWMHALAAARQAGSGGRRGADARHRALRAAVPGRAAPSQGRGAPVPPPARAHDELPRRARRARAPARARSPARRRAGAAGRGPGRDRRRRPRASHARARRTRSPATPASCGTTWAARKG